VKLNVNSIESLSTKDGEGVRFVIFLQGCNLRCIYCHNIETLNVNNGELMDIDALYKKILRYTDYFGERGGVTLSGGEPLLQSKQLIEFAKLLKQGYISDEGEKKSINITLDTSGALLNNDVEELLKYTDHVLLDLKFADEQEYFDNTRGHLKTVLKFLDECVRQNRRTWIRIVIIPNINDSEKSMDEYIKIIKKYLEVIERVELLPFHTLGFEKYKTLGVENKLVNTKGMDLKKLDELQRYIDKQL